MKLKIAFVICALITFGMPAHSIENPFSPDAACGANTEKLESLYQMFPAGDDKAPLGPSQIFWKVRRCHKRTGCGEWSTDGLLMVSQKAQDIYKCTECTSEHYTNSRQVATQVDPTKVISRLEFNHRDKLQLTITTTPTEKDRGYLELRTILDESGTDAQVAYLDWAGRSLRVDFQTPVGCERVGMSNTCKVANYYESGKLAFGFKVNDPDYKMAWADKDQSSVHFGDKCIHTLINGKTKASGPFIYEFQGAIITKYETP